MSHETIYLHVWKNKENGGSLWRRPRGVPKQRRKRYGREDSRGRLTGKHMIGERPAIMNRRCRFGDRELDTVHGRGKPCVVTAVERKSGVLRIGPLQLPCRRLGYRTPTRSTTAPSFLAAIRSLPAASSLAPVLGSDLMATSLLRLSTCI